MTTHQIISDRQQLRKQWLSEVTIAPHVFFLHGFSGNQEKTWGKFPYLLRTDLDLPTLNITSWGYRTGLLPLNLSIEREGNRFVSDAHLLVDNKARNLFVAAHSMGGLVALRGICNNFSADCKDLDIRSISLFGTPCRGVYRRWLLTIPFGSLPSLGIASGLTTVLSTVTGATLFVMFLGILKNDQLREVLSPRFGENLLKEVNEHVLNKSSVSFKIHTGTRDWIVPFKSATASFGNNYVHDIVGNHRTIKLPKDRNHMGYQSLRTQIQDTLKYRFGRAVTEAYSDHTRRKRDKLLDRICQIYGQAIKIRLNGVNVNATDKTVKRIVVLAIRERRKKQENLSIHRYLDSAIHQYVKLELSKSA